MFESSWGGNREPPDETMLLYTKLAEHYYDLETLDRNIQEEVQALGNLFEAGGFRRILDLGCATGEHVAALQERGFQAEGLDSSDSMIRIARRRFSQCRFHRGDIRDFAGALPFDAAFSIFGSFGHFLTDEELRAALGNVTNLLLPGGLFVLEVWNASPFLDIGRSAPVQTPEVRSGGRLIRRSRGFQLLRERPDIVEVSCLYELNGNRLSDRYRLRVFEVRELGALVRRAGFEIREVSSTLNGDPWSPGGSRLILKLVAGSA